MPKRTQSEITQDEEAASQKRHQKEDEGQEATPNTFQIPFKKDKHITCETRNRPGSSLPSLIFTHGAGGGLESAAMRSFATGFSHCGRVTSFQGNMNLTSRVAMFRAVVEHHQEKSKEDVLVLGGRSMGARAAVLAALELIADGKEVQALILVSYPLTASKNGKQEREFERREKILLDLPGNVDVLFVSGTRDVQCDLKALRELRESMKAGSWIVEARGADHGMGLAPKTGTDEVGQLMGEVAARWLEEKNGERRSCEIRWDGEEDKACQGDWTMAEA